MDLIEGRNLKGWAELCRNGNQYHTKERPVINFFGKHKRDPINRHLKLGYSSGAGLSLAVYYITAPFPVDPEPGVTATGPRIPPRLLVVV